MNNQLIGTRTITWIVFAMALAGLSACTKTDQATKHEHGESHEEVVKGPHGGRLLVQDKFSIEVTIFERGVPPEFRVFVYESGKTRGPSELQLTIELARFGGRVDRIEFAPKDDYLLGKTEVEEPHSFVVTVQAQYAGKSYQWNYESFEGRTAIIGEMAAAAGVTTAIVGPGKLRERLALQGQIAADPARTRVVSARYAGVIQSVSRQLGDIVRVGDTLAMIESNESLQVYAVKAPIAGTVISRHANAGETAGTEPLFEIADFSSVRAELNVFPRDFARLRKGQSVLVRSVDGRLNAEGKVGYLATTGATGNQSLIAQVTIDNKIGAWTPGLFVSADVVVGETAVALAIPSSALQKFRDWDVVFLNDGDTYQAQPIELGRNDGDTFEVTGGLSGGERFVVANSYLIKADIEKSGASHDH